MVEPHPWEEFVVFLEKLFDLLPKDPFSRGLAKFNHGDLAGATELFLGLLDHSDPEICKKARLFACEAHLQQGDDARHSDLSAALKHYREASDLQPLFADVQNKLGETYRALGRNAEARGAFQAALEINPRYLAARMNLAHTLVRLADFEAAVVEIERAIPHTSGHAKEALEALAADCRSGGEVDWENRFGDLHRLHPSEAEARRLEALKALQHGRSDEALSLVDELLEEHGKWPDLHLLRGLALGELGRPQESIAAFEDALERHPRYLKARINLGLTYIELGEPEKAANELELALETDPTNVLARAALEDLKSTTSNS